MSTHATEQLPTDRDGDLLDWLGFAPGDPEDAPLVIWPGPGVRPTLSRVPRVPRGRRRVLRPRAA